MTAWKCIGVVVVFLTYVSTLGICEERGLPINKTGITGVGVLSVEGEGDELLSVLTSLPESDLVLVVNL
ncbi:hypothetical protein Pcinc_042635 [Petrolisthes cinctipes]|uniref:Uncharacterized protein n=1 Tax=Petrolisthes cinctipes TaxID=88211 RepID=A0AAE1BKT1_PETCI|nr:hypothetical protein Pcinc_042635 [Petrolisthes cinctipes]